METEGLLSHSQMPAT